MRVHQHATKPLSGERGAGGIAVVIPSYRVRKHIMPLLGRIGPEVSHIFVVDDACPDGSGSHVRATSRDPRVVVLFHEKNQGVGGAVITGYQHALAAGAEVIIKLDGDGQMDPALIPYFAAPILEDMADYVKGNRFYNLEDVQNMPRMRLFGNAALSFITKLSSGYWNIFDPTNGYTAISASVLSHLPLHKLSRRYFFESDLLFRLGTMNAFVLDLPMAAVYAEEESSLRVGRVFFSFIAGHISNFMKRLFYSYFLRGFSVASLELIVGAVFLVFGVVFGAVNWTGSAMTGRPATTGTVMLAALPIILGVQLLLSFLSFDIAATPNRPISARLPRKQLRLEPLASASVILDKTSETT